MRPERSVLASTSGSLFFFYGKIRSPYLNMAPTVARAALPSPTMCSFGTAASVWDFLQQTDVDACDCTRWLYDYRKRVCTESRFWEKDIFNCLSGNGTRLRITPEFWAQRSTHWAIAPLRFRLCGFYFHWLYFQTQSVVSWLWIRPLGLD